jgi:NitT/TauT family transport system substrate-binding protein
MTGEHGDLGRRAARIPRRLTRRAALGAGAAGLLAACGGGSRPASPASGAAAPSAGAAAAAPTAPPPPTEAARTHLAIGYAAITASYIPVYIAAEMHAWDKYGLDIELANLPGNAGPQAMLAGQVPFMALSGFASAPAIIEGADFVVIATMIARHTARIYGAPGVDTPAALRGKRLGITRIGTLTHFGAMLALRQWGLEPDKDVTLVQLNETSNSFAGMGTGAVDAAVLTDPFSFAAQKAGYPLLIDLVDTPVDYNSSGFTVTRTYLQQNRPVLLNFLRGYLEGHKRFFDDRAYAMDVLQKYARIDDPDVLENTYALYVEKYFVKVPLPSVASLQNIIDDYGEVNPRAKGLDASPYVDPTLIQDLQREGFLRQLGLE